MIAVFRLSTMFLTHIRVNIRKEHNNMKEIRSKIIAIAAIACFAVSVASCDAAKPDSTETVVVTDTAANDSSDSAVSEAPVPEIDDDGSKISVVEVTDSNGEAVTEKNGKPVTELAVVDEKGSVVTDAKGNNVKPNIKVTTAAEKIVENQEPHAVGGNSNNNNNNNANNELAPQYIAEGPTVSLPDIEASAGETVTFKVDVTGNTGYTALLAWIEVNSKYFEFVKYDGGDLDDPDYEDSEAYNNTSFNLYQKKDAKDTSTLICTYFNSSLVTLEGNTTYATIQLKVKDKTPAGKYELSFDADGDGNGAAMCNNIVDKKVIVPTPKYKNGSITVK